jgi:hypothetical protein
MVEYARQHWRLANPAPNKQTLQFGRKPAFTAIDCLAMHQHQAAVAGLLHIHFRIVDAECDGIALRSTAGV